MNIHIRLVAACIVLLCGTITYANVSLPALVSDNMVLQQNSEVKVWGWAEPGEKISVKASWQCIFAKSVRANKDGSWKMSLRTPKAGGPHEIMIKAGNTIKLKNILTGEVWIASGQSNMEMPLKPVSKAYTGIMDFEEEIVNADYPQIRLFQVGNFSSKNPLLDVEPGVSVYNIPPAACQWKQCSPQTVSIFSSVAYFFARKLHKELGVPVGIIDSTWGGTAIESWIPAEGLKKLEYHRHLKQTLESSQKPDQKNISTRLYNGMIHPLRNLTIKGAIWYQGESNISIADKYDQLFSTMIKQWRQSFDRNFSFYFVQIAPFDYGTNKKSAILREAQLNTMLSVPKTGMAVTMDIGDLIDIHPKNKQEVGRRLGLWALANDYGKSELVFSGPIYKSMQLEGDAIRLSFDYVGSGLIAKDGDLTNFTIAGDDKVFFEAEARIENDTVVVSSEKVANPVAVRFAFSNTDVPNFFNKEGLPASSFKTDDW